MIGFLKRMFIGLLGSLGGVGTASIGGLSGMDKGELDEEGALWIDWGGSLLDIPEILQIQQAFEVGARDQEVYESLIQAQQKFNVPDPSLEAQFLNNLAVSAYDLGLDDEARSLIRSAAQIETDSWEVSETILHNLDLFGGE
jgi:hypothetical protein